MAGLLGFGGLSGAFGAPATSGFPSQYFNPEQLKAMTIKRALLGAGIGLLGQGTTPYKPSFMGQLAPGFTGAAQGAQSAQEDWLNAGKMSMDIADKQADRAAAEQERIRQAEADRREEEDRIKWDADFDVYYAGLTPEQQRLAKLDKKTFISKMIDSQFGSTEKKAPTVHSFYDPQTGQPYSAAWNDETGVWDKVGGTKAPDAGITYQDKDGNVISIGGSGAKPLTESQAKNTSYAIRAEGANPLLDTYGEALLNPLKKHAGELPVVGNYIKGMNDPDYQLGEQAGFDFLTALLRKESGATITPPEQALYGSIFLPQPGDQPETLAQKSAARKRAIAGINAGLPPLAILEKERALAENPSATATGDASAIPQDVDPDLWNAMTPEEKALWQ